MNKSLLQRATPHILAIVIFLVVSCLYNLPALKGLVINQYDMLGTIGMKQQSLEFYEKHGYYPLWTNSLFSGMPAYQVWMAAKYNISLFWLHFVFTLGLPGAVGLFFLSCVSFYILCVSMRIRPWIGIFGSLAYAFASYNAILMATGHITKFAAMGYAPAVLAGLVLLTQRKYYIGFATTLLFGTLMFYQNHVQIVYYTFIVVACMAVAYAIYTLRRQQVKHLLTSAGLAVAALAISTVSFAVFLLPLNEYAKETMRGGRSELTDNRQVKTQGGLDKDYAFNWSYGVGETFTLVLPSYKGGGSGMSELPEDNNTIEAMRDAQLPPEAINYFYGSLSTYWGAQPSTSGPVYFGAVVCLLFIAGLFVVRSWHLGWIVAATVIGILLAWGSNFAAFNYFLFDYLPYYNKFRAPSMALIIPQVTFPLLACLAVQQIFYGGYERAALRKKLKNAGVVSALLVGVLIVNYFTADFRGPHDSNIREGMSNALAQAFSRGQAPSDQVVQQANRITSSIMTGLVQDRKEMYTGDLVRTVIFILLTAFTVWLVFEKKLKPQYAVVGLVALILFDLLPVDKRYLSEKDYVSEEEYLQFFTPTQADLQIMQDTGYYRVFDQASGNPFQGPPGARASYFHNSVGGYHPAKLALYDDLIQQQLAKYNLRVYNMLNTKYFIVNGPDGQPVAQLNPDALGPVWLVKGIRYVNNADEEMRALDNFSPADTVIIDKREQSKIPFPPQFDSAASVSLVQNLNDKVTYQFNAPTNQFVVFSEVYYPHGWKAFIDGKEAPIARVNYVLRGLAVPAGAHSIEFRFEPETVKTANLISLIVGIISILLLLFCIWQAYRKKELADGSEAPDVAAKA